MRFADFLKDQKIFLPTRPNLNNPSVSVIMPTYCRAHDGMVSRAITSVLGQTYKDFEFIIIDDGSKDGTEEIVKNYQHKDNRIIYVRHSINSGLPALRVNEGIILSKGRFIAFIFDDDEWFPQFLEKLVAEALKNKKSFVCCQAEYYVRNRCFSPSFPKNSPSFDSLLQRNKIANAAVLLEKKILYEKGLYNPHVFVRRFSDWELWLRLSEQYPICLIPEVLVKINGDLEDSLSKKAERLSLEKSLVLVLSSPQNMLKPEEIYNFEVASLDVYFKFFSTGLLTEFYEKLLLPWLKEHCEDFIRHGIIDPDKKYININMSATIKNDRTKPKGTIEKLKGKIEKKIRNYSIRFETNTYYYLRRLPIVRTYFYKLALKWTDSRKPKKKKYKFVDLSISPFIMFPLHVRNGELYAIEVPLNINSYQGIVEILVTTVNDEAIQRIQIPLFTIPYFKQQMLFYFEPPIQKGKYWIQITGKDLSSPIFVKDDGGIPLFRLVRKACWKLYLK